MEIPWLYYVNILLIPLVFGYLTTVNYTHRWKPAACWYGWWMFYILLDAVILAFQTLFGIRRLILVEDWQYSLITIAACFAAMVIVLVVPRTPLKRFIPRWMSRSELENAPEEKKRKKGLRIFFEIIFFILYILFLVLLFAYRWYEQTFNVSFDALLFTITAPAKGTGDEVVLTACLEIIPGIVLMLMLYWLSVLRAKKLSGGYVLVTGKEGSERVHTVGSLRVFSRIVLVLLLTLFVSSGAYLLKLPEYIRSISQMSTIYEEHYVEPNDVKLTAADGKQRNLILIILESMETTYASTEEGGRNNINYIPYLTQLAKDNVSFSGTDKLGGFISCSGTGWTMAATIATSSGVPFSFPVGQNSMGRYERIAGGLTTLGDVLAKKGYSLEAVFGSDAAFAGTCDYYEQHGGYKVFDLQDYYDEGYVPEDFYEWWGVRDEIVYDALRKELTEQAKKDQPFAVTMFTMDTHATAGYLCEKCPNKYTSPLGNVLSCTEENLKGFLSWCEEQDWYEDTTIVITGDHPRMDSRLIDSLEPADRRVYNCIINSPKEVKGDMQNRLFTTLDMFPTIISAMGFDIPGNMLGLGTDMFSGQETLVEQYGIDWLNDQLSMKSNYYMTHFY